VTPNTFKLQTPVGNNTINVTGACSLDFSAINLLAMRTESFGNSIITLIAAPTSIPMFPGWNSTRYDAVSEILLDAPLTGSKTFAVHSNLTNGILVTKCDSVIPNCTNLRAYRVSTGLAQVRDAELLVGAGDPILLAMGPGAMKRYSLESFSSVPLTDAVFHPAVSAVVSAKLRSLRLQDQGINRSNEALLYVEHAPGKEIYRTRDAGANWYKVHTIPSTNTILDIIPAHANTKNDDGESHWEPSFLSLERFDKDGPGVGTDFDLRVIGQDWHGF
jgi:hypothetical protein